MEQTARRIRGAAVVDEILKKMSAISRPDCSLSTRPSGPATTARQRSPLSRHRGDDARRSPALTRSPDERADLGALIKEARGHRRRRRLIVGVTLLVLAGMATTGIVASRAGGGRHRGSGPDRNGPEAKPKLLPATGQQKSPGAALPPSALFNQISVTSSGLLLTGVTPASADAVDPTCVAAPVDPRTLAVGTIAQGSCHDPLLFGETVEVVNTPIPGSNKADLSIAHGDPATGQVTEGPVVMTYGSFSDTRPVTASGGPWLWVYDVETTAGPELLQVSTQSGAVVEVVPMPKLYRPLLAADDGGVWVANSLDGSPAPALSYVAAGSSGPTTVIPDTTTPVCWLVAAGTTAWLGAGTARGGCTAQTIEKYADGVTSPVFSRPGTGSVPFTVVGDATDGLWSVPWPPTVAGQQQVIHIDPSTGAESVAATLPVVPGLGGKGLVQGQAVFFDGSLYLLEPPFKENGYLGYTSLVRIRPAPVGSPESG